MASPLSAATSRNPRSNAAQRPTSFVCTPRASAVDELVAMIGDRLQEPVVDVTRMVRIEVATR